MILVFVLICVSIFFGGLFLWMSGYFIGSGSAPVQAEPNAAGAPSVESGSENSQLRLQLTEAEKRIEQMKADLEKVDSDSGEQKENVNDDELARLSSELTRSEGEKERALFEIENLTEELEELKKKGPKAPLPPPPASKASGRENEVLDDTQAQLDMEKVAHQKTRDELAKIKEELAQVKKIAAVKMASSPTFGASKDSKGKSRFQTMAFNAAPSGGGGGSQAVLQGALNKVQEERDKLQSELEKAKKEIQFLKMRS